MKKTLLTKTMLLLFALIAGSSSVWADTKTEGFETKATSTTYNSTVAISTSESDCSIAWSIYYGCVSTNDKIGGTRSAQMRWYSSATGTIPYAKTTTAIEGLSNVALKARTSNTDVKMDVCYSEDGSSWTVGKTHTFTAANTAENVSLDIPSGNEYVKFEVSSSSTAPSSGNYKLIIDDVVFTYASDKETPTWSLDPTSATVNFGESTTLQLTTNYDGTLTFESEDTDIATVSYNSSTKVITVNGIAAGSTKITATGAATATYEAVSKNITVNVTHPELASNMNDVMGPLGYSYFGLTPSGSDTYAQPDVTSTNKTDAYGITVSWARNDSKNTKPRFDVDYTRFYSGNTLTVTAPTGSTLRKIVFTEPATDKGWSGSMTTGDVGDYVSSEKTWYATTDDVASIVFTSDATKRIGGMKVYLNAPNVSITPAYNKTTCVAVGDLDFSDVAGLKAYVATDASDGKVTLEEVSAVPAGTPMMLIGTAETKYTVPFAVSPSAPAENMFRAGDGTTAFKGTTYDYILYSDGLFYQIGSGRVAANKAYLHCDSDPNPTSAPGLSIIFGDGSTGINMVNGSELKVNGEYYNLNGQRVAQPTKGLYIVNGKKVVIK